MRKLLRMHLEGSELLMNYGGYGAYYLASERIYSEVIMGFQGVSMALVSC
jgi:hypothetical protein